MGIDTPTVHMWNIESREPAVTFTVKSINPLNGTIDSDETYWVASRDSNAAILSSRGYRIVQTTPNLKSSSTQHEWPKELDVRKFQEARIVNSGKWLMVQTEQREFRFVELATGKAISKEFALLHDDSDPLVISGDGNLLADYRDRIYSFHDDSLLELFHLNREKIERLSNRKVESIEKIALSDDGTRVAVLATDDKGFFVTLIDLDSLYVQNQK